MSSPDSGVRGAPLRIGVDVGGTHTDAVLMEDDRLVAKHKGATTADVTSGVLSSLTTVLELGAAHPDDVAAVMLGTTHFTNAFVEGRDLASVAIIRLGHPATTAVPPLSDWPDDVRAHLRHATFLCRGGHEFDGREITALDPDELVGVADTIGREGLESIAVCGVFSPVDPSGELRAAEILSALLPDVPVSTSHEIGRVGMLARENATVVNASLRPLAQRTVRSFREAIRALGITAPVFISQNDGTLADLSETERYPVTTFTSGPTNSMRGAAFLSGLLDCAVVDIGGTTADIGVIQHGFPRETASEAEVAGVRTNFRLPDVLSLGIGGGSIVAPGREPEHGVAVGPRSVGHRLTTEALVFGGQQITATDLAVAAGRADVGDATLVSHLDRAVVDRALRQVEEAIGRGVDDMRTSAEPLPVVLVGGGSVLLEDELPGVRLVVRPPHFEVANAVGAAMAQVGATAELICSLESTRREDALAEATRRAHQEARGRGADEDTLRVVDVEEAAIAYVPGQQTRIRVRVVGDLTREGLRAPSH